MVLVSYKPYNYVSILQTKLGHREGHEARRMGLEAMPLDQDIKGGHGEREPGVEIRPHAVRDPLANNWLQVFRRQKLLAAVIREAHRGIRVQGGQKNAGHSRTDAERKW